MAKRMQAGLGSPWWTSGWHCNKVIEYTASMPGLGTCGYVYRTKPWKPWRFRLIGEERGVRRHRYATQTEAARACEKAIRAALREGLRILGGRQ